VDHRLTALDASFLEIESPTSPMHVGWGALFAPPDDRPKPTFADVLEHVGARMGRAPRYRQRLERVPLGLDNPVWVDDPDFAVANHVKPAAPGDFGDAVDAAMSTRLDLDRPLWEIHVADGLPDGWIGLVGKVHHCMVDGVAAVELAALLLDATPDPPPPEPDGWRPDPEPTALALAAGALRDRLRGALALARLPVVTLSSPRRLWELPGRALRAGRALVRSAMPAPAPTSLREPLSTERHLAVAHRPLEDLRHVGRHFGATVNDVLLAAAAGGVREDLERCQEPTVPLKAMVPVSVRGEAPATEMGNRVSFMFLDLPCDEGDPVRRLERVKAAMAERKRAREPEGGEELLQALEWAPRTVQRVASHLVASPRTFNLTVSNIPGPPSSLYMLGCELEAAYPVVPLPERHGLSIGMTTVGEEACFGVYGDPECSPDADVVARGIESSIAELLGAT
jgi:WS/DGAT/MGAT family acyltransferase